MFCVDFVVINVDGESFKCIKPFLAQYLNIISYQNNTCCRKIETAINKICIYRFLRFLEY